MDGAVFGSVVCPRCRRVDELSSSFFAKFVVPLTFEVGILVERSTGEECHATGS